MKPSGRTWRSRRGFTLVELLVVVLVLVLLLLFALPSYERPRPGRQFVCLSNLKQMNLSWIMYASDSGEKLITNRPYASAAELPLDNWVAGVMDWTANPQNTNLALLLAAALSPYLKNAQVYRCPDDKSESVVGPRVRSYSMNGFLGNYGGMPNFHGWKSALKLQDVRSPASTFVFAEEHANSIDDGFFINDPNQTSAWIDLPAANHVKGSAGFGFADGHSEIHKWVEASTRQPVNPSGPKPAVQLKPSDVGTDLAWVLKSTGAINTNAVSEPPK
jgi:prepilin-type N-terminal cleavage/methylation domain-containing protein